MERYAKQILVKQIGKKGQEKIKKATIAILGIGALGTVVAELAARAGIGKILLYDYDVVDETNLQRQHLFTEKDIGSLKVLAAAEHLRAINSKVRIDANPIQIDPVTLETLHADILFECSDNLKTKALVNDYALAKNIPSIIGTAAGTKGYVFGVSRAIGCMREVFPLPNVFDETTTVDDCSTLGVINSLTAMIGSIMFSLGLRFLVEKTLPPNVYYLNAWDMSLTTLKRKPQCQACQQPQQFFNKQWQQEETTQLKALCGNDRYAYKGNFSLQTIKQQLPEAKDLGNALQYKEFIILQNQILFPASSLTEAKKKIQSFLNQLSKNEK